MSKKIFITRKIPEVGIAMLKSKGYEVEVNPKDKALSQKELIKHLQTGQHDAVLCLLTDKIDANVFEKAPSVKIFANYASGFDNIDVAEAKKRGVIISNAPANSTSEAVAQHALAMMLALATRITEADTFVRKGKYKGWMPMNLIGVDLLGKTLGLVGAGRIGSRVAFYAKALGMKIIYTDVAKSEQLEKDCGAVFYATLEELLRNADVVSLHVPLLDSTKHLINASRLAIMKPASFLINTSRGPVIDEKALVEALKNNVIGGAALDVFEFEPKLSKGLTKLSNVILTPHIASASITARNEMAEIAANNIIDFIEGRKPRNAV